MTDEARDRVSGKTLTSRRGSLILSPDAYDWLRAAVAGDAQLVQLADALKRYENHVLSPDEEARLAEAIDKRAAARPLLPHGVSELRGGFLHYVGARAEPTLEMIDRDAQAEHDLTAKALLAARSGGLSAEAARAARAIEASAAHRGGRVRLSYGDTQVSFHVSHDPSAGLEPPAG